MIRRYAIAWITACVASQSSCAVSDPTPPDEPSAPGSPGEPGAPGEPSPPDAGALSANAMVKSLMTRYGLHRLAFDKALGFTNGDTGEALDVSEDETRTFLESFHPVSDPSKLAPQAVPVGSCFWTGWWAISFQTGESSQYPSCTSEADTWVMYKNNGTNSAPCCGRVAVHGSFEAGNCMDVVREVHRSS